MGYSSTAMEYNPNSFQNKNILQAKKWNKVILILKYFNYNINNLKLNLKNQDYCWNLIISIQKDLKNQIPVSIKKITGFCYQIGNKKQANQIIRKFLRLNHLLDQNIYKYQFNSYYGLYNFLKILKTTYGNVEFFLEALDFLYKVFDFFENDYNTILINKFNYLSNISLPENGYNNLKNKLNNIMERFNYLFPVIKNQDKLNIFLNDINEFKKLYITRYQKEHNQFQKKLKKFYDELYSLPEYILLQKLSETKFKINKEIPVKKYIDNFFPRVCNHNRLKQFLKKHPECSCGFSLDSNIYVPSIEKILPMLKEGIDSYTCNKI